MKRERTAAILVALVVAGGLGAQADPWVAAPAPDKKLILACDELVLQRKYLSAYEALGPEPRDDDYLIAKRLELCARYFVRSVDHRFFSLVDLTEGESLDELRLSDGDFTIVASDPAAKAEAYLALNPQSPIVAMALGDFYKRTLPIYLALGDSASALGEAQALFSLSPHRPQAAKTIMDSYYAAKRYDELAAFFEWGVKSYWSDDEALGNVYFHYSQLAHDTKDDALARSLIDKAEKAFKHLGAANQKIFDAITRQREFYGEQE
jgi:hypothetical protein